MVLDLDRVRSHVDQRWADDIVDVLHDFIAIPDVSPAFDPDWDEHAKHPSYSSHVFVEQSSPSQGARHEHTGSPIAERTHAPLPLQYTSLLHAAPASAVVSSPSVSSFPSSCAAASGASGVAALGVSTAAGAARLTPKSCQETTPVESQAARHSAFVAAATAGAAAAGAATAGASSEGFET